VWDIFKELLGLWVDVFKEYKLAAAITTLLFVLGYFAWTQYNKKKGITPGAFWENPAFVLFIGWCIVTPLLGFIFKIVSTLKEVLSPVLELYLAVFKLNLRAGAIVAGGLLPVYFIWKLILKKWGRHARGVWRYPALVLLAVWLIITSIVGLILK